MPQGGTYGEERGGGVAVDVMERVVQNRPVVQLLGELEVRAQHSFLTMGKRFGVAT